jgi:2,4-dienoyl-CoA reductase-like NADH-dependent reductase (Old Yellow Enzyme family)/thioredoxin reductase
MQLLFSPIKVGNIELKNRIIMAPMGTGSGNVGGTVSEKMIKYYVRRAMGGVSMIIVETTTVDPSGLISETRLRIDDDRYLEGLSVLAREIKAHGAKAAIQLSHRGRQASKEEIGALPVAPSALPAPGYKEKPRELASEEIYQLIGSFAEGARRAKDAGFDAIEIHGAHGYLICQFLSKSSNIRTDEFGGNLTGRSKFATEIVRQIRKKVGNGFPIIFRFSADEHVENGITIEEAKIIAQLLEESGADALHISAGNYETFEWVVQPMTLPRGCLVNLAAEIKSVATVPVITVGRINNPILAESILQEGKADLIALGRSLIADPDFPIKAAEDREKEIRRCIACNMCVDSRVRLKTDIKCSVNPEFGKEEEYNYKPAKSTRKILVVGGGPAGMEAARVAKIRGHQVILCEATDRLGGQLILAAKSPSKKEIASITEYYEYQLKRLGVSIEFNNKVTPELVQKIRPDVVIIATGTIPINASDLGIESDHKYVFTSHDVLGEKVVLTGKDIVIIGAGSVGCETAEFLSEKGMKITFIEMLDEAATDMEQYTRKLLFECLAECNTDMLLRSNVKQIDKECVIYSDAEGKDHSIKASSVIMAVGSMSNNTLINSLDKKEYSIFEIGDCVEPRSIMDAISEGFSIACEI